MSRPLDAELGRRDFLRVSAALGGGLLVAFRFSGSAKAMSALAGPESAADFAPNAFVRVAPDGRVTVIINKAEMGQGVATSLSMLVAEELDADWQRVGFEFAPAADEYKDPNFGMQMTGGSSSVAGMGEPLRKAGAAARALLIAAAAQGWSVPASECSTEPGVVAHKGSGKRSDYGPLTAVAATLPVPADVKLKDPKDFRLLGHSTPRLDTADKAAGRATFAMDVRRPGQLVAVVAHAPTFGGVMKSFQADEALRVPGVVKVVPVDSGVAVVAKGFWAARCGREKLKIEWVPGPDGALSSDELRERYRKLAQTRGLVARNEGDVDKALASASRVLTADYELPWLAHATMEPLNCVVELKPDSCEVWAGSQFQTVDQAAIAKTAGLKLEQVKLHSTFLGGGFGRRANPVSDYIVEAVQIARAANAPIQMIWTREDDMRAGYYRPMWHSRMQGAVGAAGISGWTHTIVGQSIVAGTPFEAFMVKDGIDDTSVEGAKELPYAIPNLRVELHTTKLAVPTLWWRSVGHSHTAFVVESFLDELAHATGEDPLALRRRLLSNPRLLGVLELACKQAGWGTPVPAGHARGLAVHESFHSFVAYVAEVSLHEGRPRIHRVTAGVDCGRVVNPDGVRAQIEGAVGFGLTATLYSEITLKDGQVQQGNFHDYRMLRMPEMPAVDVHLVPSEEKTTGIGEPGVPPVAPAVCNALFTLTGKRIRRLPIRTEDLA
jgi:isoquinoline 1-oxidoreductase beta subunit